MAADSQQANRKAQKDWSTTASKVIYHTGRRLDSTGSRIRRTGSRISSAAKSREIRKLDVYSQNPLSSSRPASSARNRQMADQMRPGGPEKKDRVVSDQKKPVLARKTFTQGHLASGSSDNRSHRTGTDTGRTGSSRTSNTRTAHSRTGTNRYRVNRTQSLRTAGSRHSVSYDAANRKALKQARRYGPKSPAGSKGPPGYGPKSPLSRKPVRSSLPQTALKKRAGASINSRKTVQVKTDRRTGQAKAKTITALSKKMPGSRSRNRVRQTVQSRGLVKPKTVRALAKTAALQKAAGKNAAADDTPKAGTKDKAARKAIRITKSRVTGRMAKPKKAELMVKGRVLANKTSRRAVIRKSGVFLKPKEPAHIVQKGNFLARQSRLVSGITHYRIKKTGDRPVPAGKVQVNRSRLVLSTLKSTRPKNQTPIPKKEPKPGGKALVKKKDGSSGYLKNGRLKAARIQVTKGVDKKSGQKKIGLLKTRGPSKKVLTSGLVKTGQITVRKKSVSTRLALAGGTAVKGIGLAGVAAGKFARLLGSGNAMMSAIQAHADGDPEAMSKSMKASQKNLMRTVRKPVKKMAKKVTRPARRVVKKGVKKVTKPVKKAVKKGAKKAARPVARAMKKTIAKTAKVAAKLAVQAAKAAVHAAAAAINALVTLIMAFWPVLLAGIVIIFMMVAVMAVCQALFGSEELVNNKTVWCEVVEEKNGRTLSSEERAWYFFTSRGMSENQTAALIACLEGVNPDWAGDDDKALWEIINDQVNDMAPRMGITDLSDLSLNLNVLYDSFFSDNENSPRQEVMNELSEDFDTNTVTGQAEAYWQTFGLESDTNVETVRTNASGLLARYRGRSITAACEPPTIVKDDVKELERSLKKRPVSQSGFYTHSNGYKNWLEGGLNREAYGTENWLMAGAFTQLYGYYPNGMLHSDSADVAKNIADADPNFDYVMRPKTGAIGWIEPGPWSPTAGKTFLVLDLSSDEKTITILEGDLDGLANNWDVAIGRYNSPAGYRDWQVRTYEIEDLKDQASNRLIHYASPSEKVLKRGSQITVPSGRTP